MYSIETRLPQKQFLREPGPWSQCAVNEERRTLRVGGLIAIPVLVVAALVFFLSYRHNQQQNTRVYAAITRLQTGMLTQQRLIESSRRGLEGGEHGPSVASDQQKVQLQKGAKTCGRRLRPAKMRTRLLCKTSQSNVIPLTLRRTSSWRLKQPRLPDVNSGGSVTDGRTKWPKLLARWLRSECVNRVFALTLTLDPPYSDNQKRGRSVPCTSSCNVSAAHQPPRLRPLKYRLSFCQTA